MAASELISLVRYLSALHLQGPGKELFDAHRLALENCSPLEISLAIDNLICRVGQEGIPGIEQDVARFIRAASSGLDRLTVWVPGRPGLPPPVGQLFLRLHEDNLSLQKLSGELRGHLKADDWRKWQGDGSLAIRLEALAGHARDHYHLLQYELFPLLEAAHAPTRCTALMWHMQDEVLADLARLSEGGRPEADFAGYSRRLSAMFLRFNSLIYREERILLPLAEQFLSGDQRAEH